MPGHRSSKQASRRYGAAFNTSSRPPDLEKSAHIFLRSQLLSSPAQGITSPGAVHSTTSAVHGPLFSRCAFTHAACRSSYLRVHFSEGAHSPMTPAIKFVTTPATSYCMHRSEEDSHVCCVATQEDRLVCSRYICHTKGQPCLLTFICHAKGQPCMLRVHLPHKRAALYAQGESATQKGSLSAEGAISAQGIAQRMNAGSA
eukprot:1152973-Pelagomonas_calceolata.AAC.9